MLLSPTVKKFVKIGFGEVRDKSLVSRFFLTHSVLRFVVDFFVQMAVQQIHNTSK